MQIQIETNCLCLRFIVFLSGSSAAGRRRAWMVPTGTIRETPDWGASAVEIAGLGPRCGCMLQGQEVPRAAATQPVQAMR
jgi:hypothetical protein